MENRELTNTWKLYQSGKNYLRKMELDTIIPMCVDFYEGRHWGKIGEKTKKLPRATFNMIEMIVNSKVSTMTSSPLKVVFNSQEMTSQAEKLTRFNSIIENEIKFNELCEDILDQSAVEGSSFIHFYWDSDAFGKRGEYKGGVRAEKFDLLNVFVENPCEQSIQKQKWIILESLVSLNEAKSLCENEADKKLIEADTYSSDTNKEMVTVLTKYFRVDGEVFFERATKNVVLHKPRPLNPEYSQSKDNYYRFRANLYPVEVYQYKTRKNCIYGRGEVEPIIPNNRTINFNTAMMSKGVEDQGFGTIVQREGALKVGEKLTNDSSKILVDRYKGGQNGFYSLQKTPFTPEAYQLNKDILSTTREITGITEIMTGEALYANQSGASIAYLQQQALKPLDKLTKRFKSFRIRCAEILFQFYCLFYEDKEFSYKNQDLEFENQDITIKESFSGKEYRNIDFDISIEIGATNEFSEISELNLIDSLLKQNLITLETYYKLYPSHLLPSKERLLNELKNQEEKEINKLKQENIDLKNKLEILEKNIKSQSEIYSDLTSTINQNTNLMKLISELKKENKGGENANMQKMQ